MKREVAQEYIGQISRLQVILTSALSGFSFGSEVFLIFGIWRETQAIAGTMLVGRLLHPLILIYILCVMFLSDNVKNMLTSCIPQAKLWGSHLHKDFAREVLPIVAVIIIVCMGKFFGGLQEVYLFILLITFAIATGSFLIIYPSFLILLKTAVKF